MKRSALVSLFVACQAKQERAAKLGLSQGVGFKDVFSLQQWAFRYNFRKLLAILIFCHNSKEQWK
jgi:hypothetical protein